MSADLGQPLSKTQAEASTVRVERFRKTRLCKFHVVGACTRGEDCNFAHSIVQVREQPDFSKTRLCPDFKNFGRCEKGDECTFAHGKRDLRGKRTKAEQIQQAQQTCMQGAGFQAQMPIVYMLPMMLKPGWVGSQESKGQEHSEISTYLPDSTSRQTTSEISAYLPDSTSRQTTAGNDLDAFEEFNCCISSSSASEETSKNSTEETLPELDAESEQLHSRISEDWNWGIGVKNTFLNFDDHDYDEEPFIQRSKSMPRLWSMMTSDASLTLSLSNQCA